MFKNTWFARFADKEGITDRELLEMVNQLEAGQAEADLGSGVFKLRLARPGEGKSGGYRVIVFFRSEERTFFVYGFAKSRMSNISQEDLRVYKIRSKEVLSLTEEQINERLRMGKLIEIL